MKRLLLFACIALYSALAYGQELSLAVLNKSPYYYEKVGLENSSGDFIYLYRNGDKRGTGVQERNLVCFYLPDEGKLIPFERDTQDMSVKPHVYWQKGNQYVFLFESYTAKMDLEVYDVKTEQRIAGVKGIVPMIQGSKELDTDRVLYLKQKKFLYVSSENGGGKFVLRVYNFGNNESKVLSELSPNLDAASGRMLINDFDYNPSTDAFSWKAQ